MSRLHGDGLNVPIGLVQGTPTPVAYTPVVTWAGNTITTQSGFYLKTPGLLQVWVSFVETVGTAAAAITITIPTGYTAVSMAGGLAAPIGQLYNSVGIGLTCGLIAAAGATTQVSNAGGNPTGIVGTWYAAMTIPTLA